MFRVRLFVLTGLALVVIGVGSAEAGWPPLHHRPVIATGPVVGSAAVVPVTVVTPATYVVAEPVAIVVAQPVVVAAPVVVRPFVRPGILIAPRFNHR